MKLLRILIPFSLISLLYNFAILVSVTLNLDWVRTRAAGGQFKDFPIGIRALDLIIALFMLFLMALLWNHKDKPMDSKGPMITRLIGYTFFISAFLQTISRSTNERWNAIPALILAITFLAISKREQIYKKHFDK